MFITTKAVFEWDNELQQYVEVETDGYDYEGELALADDKQYEEGGIGREGYGVPNVSGKNNIFDQYGTEAVSPWLTGNRDLFTKITEGMREATTRQAYQPFFEVKQQAAQQDYINNLKKAGLTSKGAAIGFAGSTANNTMMDSLQTAYGEQMFDVEQDISSKISDARRYISDIVSSNQQTALTLKQLQEA